MTSPPPRTGWELAGLGVQFLVLLLGGLALGGWLDARWGTRPWLQLLGVGLGFAGGLALLARRMRGNGGM